MKFHHLLGLLSLALLSTGCAMSMNAPVSGFIYTGAKGATAATSSDVGSKTGTACAKSYLGWVGVGDASVGAAAKEGGITKISTVSSDNTNIIGVYAKNCTIVTGE